MSIRRHAVSFLVPYVVVPIVLASLAACAMEQVAGDESQAPEPEEDFGEAAPFTETYWQLTSLLGKNVPAHELRHQPHLVFHEEDNAVAGNGGCNSIAGAWYRQGSTLELAQLSTTRMGCTEGQETERSFLSALGSARSWRIVNQHLELYDPVGRRLARFAAIYVD